MTDSTHSTIASDINARRIPVVFTRTGEAFASSRDVAAFFEKRHDHVLAAIDNLLKSLVTENSGAESRAFLAAYFTDETQPGRTFRAFDMTRDGFTLLAMGFNGTKALHWKLKYIEAFNIMEAELRSRPVVDPMKALNDPAMMRTLLLGYSEKVLALQVENASLAPKADALDRIATSEGALGLIEAAKALQMRPKDLIGFLKGNGWIYRRPGGSAWLGYQTRTSAGDLEHKVTTVNRADGSEKIVEQVKVTPRGLAKLAKVIPNRLSVVGSAAA